jgi:hypothetical protein
VRLFTFFILLTTCFSCVSIRNNYLGSTNCEQISTDRIFESNNGKKIKLAAADSLLKVITEVKKQKRSLKALDINYLYTNFGKQLNEDRYYLCLLQNQPIVKDHLSNEQYLATLELLSSASDYENSYQKNRFVRRTLNRGDSGNSIPKHILYKTRNFLFSNSIRKKLVNQFDRNNSPLADSLLKRLPATNCWKSLTHRLFKNNDRIHSFFYGSAYVASYLFGNAVGIFHHDANPEKNASNLQPFLRPFDLVLMRSPNHLTNKFIPGYFGHVGIWLGNNFVERYLIKPFEKHRKDGVGIVEVLRSGLQISTLKEFADGEIFLVMRPENLTRKQKRSILFNIRKQLTKSYDFNFDIESPEAITCTELVYLTYDYVEWRIRYTMERYTISPDDLVLTALKGNQFTFKAFVEEKNTMIDPEPSFIKSLVGDPKP